MRAISSDGEPLWIREVAVAFLREPRRHVAAACGGDYGVDALSGRLRSAAGERGRLRRCGGRGRSFYRGWGRCRGRRSGRRGLGWQLRKMLVGDDVVQASSLPWQRLSGLLHLKTASPEAGSQAGLPAPRRCHDSFVSILAPLAILPAAFHMVVHHA